MTYLRTRQVHLRHVGKVFPICSFGGWCKILNFLPQGSSKCVPGTPVGPQDPFRGIIFIIILRNYLPFLLTFFHECRVFQRQCDLITAD